MGQRCRTRHVSFALRAASFKDFDLYWKFYWKFYWSFYGPP
jgi:hypothetical protein